MRRFWLFVNRKKPNADEMAQMIRRNLMENGAESVFISEKIDRETVLRKADCVLTLGGDGTIIRAARQTAGSGIPIAGLNLGHLGYLAAVSRRVDLDTFLDALLTGNFETEDRMMLECSVTHPENSCIKTPERSFLALNEAVVSRKTAGGPAYFSVYINEAFLNEYKADGIIISTPTGSTAYNLSAGGPIVDPTARMQILTPICPHALCRSSIVMKAEDRLDIRIPDDQEGLQSVSFDGAVSVDLDAGSCVKIRESKLTTPLIRMKGGTFLTRLQNKMTAI